MQDKKVELLQELIQKVADYERHYKKKASFSTQHFAQFLAHGVEEAVPKKRKLAGSKEKAIQKKGERRETGIAILITFMHRYAKLHARKIFASSKINSLDDFSYLIVLLTHNSISKTELIRKNVHEKATGMEILRRLEAQQLLQQSDATADRRSKLVSITPAGRAEVFAVLQALEQLSTLITGNLTEEEKQQLQRLLLKLDEFHFEVYRNHKDAAVADIIARNLQHQKSQR